MNGNGDELHELRSGDDFLACQRLVTSVREAFSERFLHARAFGPRVGLQGDPEAELKVWLLVNEASDSDQEIAEKLAFEIGIDLEMPRPIGVVVMSPQRWTWLKTMNNALVLEIDEKGVDL